MTFPQFNLPWKGPPIEPNRRDRIVYLKGVVDIVALEVQRIINSMDPVDRKVYGAALDDLETAHTALVGTSAELDDAEFQFTRPGAKSLTEAMKEVLEEREED